MTPSALLGILNRFPSKDMIEALMPDSGELGHRKYSCDPACSDKEILAAREELEQLVTLLEEEHTATVRIVFRKQLALHRWNMASARENCEICHMIWKFRHKEEEEETSDQPE